MTDGRTYIVAFINEFNRIAKKYEAGPLDSFVPTIKSVIRVSNLTQVIPAGCTSYNFVILVDKPKEYQYFFEHAYEDKEEMEGRKKQLEAVYPRPMDLDKMGPRGWSAMSTLMCCQGSKGRKLRASMYGRSNITLAQN